MIRVAIVASGPAMRAGLRIMLEAEPQLELVGELAPLAEAADASIAEAEVLVVYRTLPRWLEQLRAPASVLLLSDDAAGAEQLRGGTLAWALLPEEAAGSEIAAAVAALHQGLIVIHPQLLARLTGAMSISDEDQQRESLTGREREVLQLLGQGLSNRQIGERLGISEHTVKFHVSAIYGKLGVAGRAEAIRIGARSGLIVL